MQQILGRLSTQSSRSVTKTDNKNTCVLKNLPDMFLPSREAASFEDIL